MDFLINDQDIHEFFDETDLDSNKMIDKFEFAKKLDYMWFLLYKNIKNNSFFI